MTQSACFRCPPLYRRRLEVKANWQLGNPFLRNDNTSSCFCNLFDEMIRIVPFVGQRYISLDTLDKIVGQGDIIALPGSADKAYW